MTLSELYQTIDGDYEQALRVLRIDRLLDKHIRKLVRGGVITRLLDCEQNMDPTELFEAAHAAKGVCGNLGLTKLADASSEIAEEFRPGNARSMSDEEVVEKLHAIAQLYAKTEDGIRQYEAG